MRPVIALVMALALSGPAFSQGRAPICNAAGKALQAQVAHLEATFRIVATAKVGAPAETVRQLDAATDRILAAISDIKRAGGTIVPLCNP